MSSVEELLLGAGVKLFFCAGFIFHSKNNLGYAALRRSKRCPAPVFRQEDAGLHKPNQYNMATEYRQTYFQPVVFSCRAITYMQDSRVKVHLEKNNVKIRIKV
jgi:hypothetical protein